MFIFSSLLLPNTSVGGPNHMILLILYRYSIPMSTYHVFGFFRAQYSDRYAKFTVFGNKFDVGVVLRAANQNQLIAGGNQLIPSMNHRRYIA